MKLNRFWIRIIPVMLACAAIGTAQLTVTPSTLTFQAQGGGTAQPLDSTVSVTAGFSTTFTISVDKPWVFVYDATSGNQILSSQPVSTPEVLAVRLMNTPVAPGTYSAQAGGAPPPAQQITVGGNGNTVPFHVDNPNSWLQVIPADGSTDAVLSVIASPNVSAGYY